MSKRGDIRLKATDTVISPSEDPPGHQEPPGHATLKGSAGPFRTHLLERFETWKREREQKGKRGERRPFDYIKRSRVSVIKKKT